MTARFSRRDLLRRGGTLAAAAGALTLAPLGRLPLVKGDSLATDSLVSGPLRKCISLGGPGSLRVDDHPDNYLLWGNREFIRDSGTKWVKLWVSWFDLQQEVDSPPASRARSWEQLNNAPAGAAFLRRLDKQIRAVNDDGLGVALTVFHAFPTWSSGATGPDPISRRKPPEQKLPIDLSPNGPWGWFIGHLCARYKQGAAPNLSGPRAPVRDNAEEGDAVGNPDGAWIGALEVCNEPNLLFWPQEGVVEAVVEMIQSAERLSAAVDGPALLVPATSDFPDRNQETALGVTARGWPDFTERVLDGLKGFRPRVPVHWSQHNFQDVKHEQSPSRAEQVVELLDRKGWTSHVKPLWLTEGGFDLFPDQEQVSRRAEQAQLIERSFLRTREVSQVYMWTQHTITDKPGNDFKSGLRDDFAAGRGPGDKRPAWTVWRDLPGSPTV